MVKGFLDGMTAYGKALSLISELRLWNYLIIPAALSLLLGAGIFATAWGLSDNIGALLISVYPWEWGAAIVAKIAEITGGLLVGIFGLLLYKNLTIILVGPFMSPLSEKVEMALIGTPASGFSLTQMISDFVRGLRIALRNIIREIFYTLLLLLLSLFPVFAPFTTVLIFLVQAFYAGFGNFDFYLERHLRVRESVTFARQNKGLMMGNGAVFLLLLLTGIGFLFAPTLGPVAATVEGVKKISRQAA